MTDDSKQAKRIVFMLKKLQNGDKLTAIDFKDMIHDEFGPVSLRTVQRDLKVLEECETAVDVLPEGKSLRYYIPRTMRRGVAMRIESNDLLSFHILKAHLKTFKGTMIEEHTKHLSDQLDEYFPYNIFEKESLYWNKNIGQFDYTDYYKTIRQVIHNASKGEWVEIIYSALDNPDQPIILKGILDSIFTYYGYLYVAAYVTKHKKYIALAIHRIDKIQRIDKQNVKVPKFNFTEFASSRFGVFEAEPTKVMLRIKKKYAHYFENRFWHNSQRFTRDIHNNLLISMNVPIAPDFISWVFSWGDIITVLKPNSLRAEILHKADDLISSYESTNFNFEYEGINRNINLGGRFGPIERLLSSGPDAKSSRAKSSRAKRGRPRKKT